ncbi:MAG: hypothetical protein ACI837_002586 [Crocinitomicaceae bacterium]|jgi:hypothetical protein
MTKLRKVFAPKVNSSIFLFLGFAFSGMAQDSDSPFVNYDQFEALVKEVRIHRKTRLLSMDDFNTMSTKENVFILDTRSKAMYDAKHIKGAIHLNFSDFTQANLDKLLGSRDATILIYCNNNIDEGVIDESVSIEFFATKESGPAINFEELMPIPELELYDGEEIEFPENRGEIQLQEEVEEPVELDEPVERAEIVNETPPITLALNIPTYINLFGYGYRNVYELKDLVSVNDPRIAFEGTAVKEDE